MHGHQLLDVAHRLLGEPLLEQVEIERQVLDPAAAELDVGEAQPLGDHRRRAPGHRQHLGGHVDADHPALGADHLGGDEADLAGAAAQVEDRLAGLEVAAGVAAAVVALEHLVGDHLEVAGVVVDGAAQVGLALAGAVAVTLFDRLFDVGKAHLLAHS